MFPKKVPNSSLFRLFSIVCCSCRDLAAAMSSLGLGGLCLAADPFVAAGACVIGIVVCVVDPEFGLLCECDDVPFEDGCDTDREGVERGVVELLGVVALL